jgi:hypothetical protein
MTDTAIKKIQRKKFDKNGKQKMHKFLTNVERTSLYLDLPRRHTAFQYRRTPARNVNIPTSSHLKNTGYSAPGIQSGVTTHVQLTLGMGPIFVTKV